MLAFTAFGNTLHLLKLSSVWSTRLSLLCAVDQPDARTLQVTFDWTTFRQVWCDSPKNMLPVPVDI